MNLGQIRNSLQVMLEGISDDVEILNNSKDSIKFRMGYRGINFYVWYSSRGTDNYGFNMLNGGSKTYADFESLREYFCIYVDINTFFIPNSKQIADKFEKEVEYNTVYSTFSGNKNGGYVAKFNVLEDEELQVYVRKNQDNVYSASLVNRMDGSSVLTFHYRVDDAGNVFLDPDMQYYLVKMNNAVKNSNLGVDFIQTGENSVRLTYNDIIVNSDILFNYFTITYSVTEINGKKVAKDDGIFSPKNPFDLEGIYKDFADIYDFISWDGEGESGGTGSDADKESGSDESVNGDVVEEFGSIAPAGGNAGEISGDTEEITDTAEESGSIESAESNTEETSDMEEESGSVEPAECNTEEISDMGEESADMSGKSDSYVEESGNTEYSSADTVTTSEKDNKVEESTNKIDEDAGVENMTLSSKTSDTVQDLVSDNNSNNENEAGDKVEFSNAAVNTGYTQCTDNGSSVMVLLIKDSGNIVGVRFQVGSDMYDITKEKAIQFRIPLRAVKNSTEKMEIGGMLLTEQEVRLKTFAEDITDNDDKIRECLLAIFSSKGNK